jgi:hypothetical protein
MTSQGSDLYNQLYNFGSGVMSNPMSGLEQVQKSGEESINSSYGNVGKTISKAMASRGYGSSGSFGNTMYQTQLGRLGALGQYKGKMAETASNRQMSVAEIMAQMLKGQTGSSTTGTQSTSSLDGIGSLLGTLMSAFYGGGSSGSSSGGGYV